LHGHYCKAARQYQTSRVHVTFLTAKIGRDPVFDYLHTLLLYLVLFLLYSFGVIPVDSLKVLWKVLIEPKPLFIATSVTSLRLSAVKSFFARSIL
jgi:Na+/serine symporter